MFPNPAAYLALSLVVAVGAPSTLPEKWAIDTGAPIHAPAAVDGDRVFVGNQAGRLTAVEIDTGEVAWTFQAGGALDGQAAVGGDALFVQSRSGHLHAIARADGRELWRSGTDEAGAHDSWDFTLAAPVLHRDTVVVGTSGGLRVYDRRTGTPLWQLQTQGPVRGTPAIAEDIAYFGSFDGRVTAVDLVRRETLWQFKTLGSHYFPDGAVQGGPAMEGGLVHVGSRDYNLYVLDRATGRVMWNLRTPSWVIGAPAIDAHRVYFGTSDSHRVYALDRQTGEPAWTFDTASRVFASPVLHGGIAYVASFDGRIQGLDAASGELRRAYRTRGGVRNHALVYGEDGALAEEFQALRRDGDHQEAERRILQLGSVISAPALAGDTLVFGSTDGHLYALDLAAEAGAGQPAGP